MTSAALFLSLCFSKTPPQVCDATLLNLAQSLAQRGHFHEAEQLYLGSSTVQAALQGEFTYAAARSLLRLGAIYHAELKLAPAEVATRRASELFKTLKGPESPDYAYSLANLAAVLADQNQLARAEPVLRRAIFLLGKTLPPSDPVINRIEANLGLVYLRQHEYRKAELTLNLVLEHSQTQNLEEAPPVGRTPWSAAHPQVGLQTKAPMQTTVLAALAELAIAERHWIKAKSLIHQAFQLSSAEDGPQLAGMLHLRAAVEAHERDFTQAAVDLKHAISLLESTNPATRVLANLLADRAGVLQHLGLRHQAHAERNRARDIRRYGQNQ